MAKVQIRRGVFETNSSSVHSLTMVSEEEYDNWKNNKDIYIYDSVFFMLEKGLQKLERIS